MENHLNIKMNKSHVQANLNEEESVWVRDFIPKESEITEPSENDFKMSIFGVFEEMKWLEITWEEAVS